jgi:tetratricopeptide (TPR) repeat protein
MTSPASHAELKELLRNVDTPLRLRGNRFLGGRLPADARPLVEQALGELPPQWRVIVVRCDLAAELHTTVAHELGISTRHLYRQRNNALTLLCEILESVSLSSSGLRTVAESTTQAAADPDDIVRATANFLFTSGREREATAFLEQALVESGDDRWRFGIALVLSEFWSRAFELEKARDALSSAQHIWARTPEVSASPALKLEFATSQGAFFVARRDWGRAQRCLSEAIAGSKFAFGHESRNRWARAAVHARIWLIHVLLSQNQWTAARPIALEARRLVDQFGIQGILRSQTMTNSVTIHACSGTPSDAVISDALAAYDFAQSIALPQECVRAAHLLASIFSASARHVEAVRFGVAARNWSRTVPFDSYCLQWGGLALARAFLESGDLSAAKATLIKTVSSIPPESVLSTAKALEAEILHEQKHYLKAKITVDGALRGMAEAHLPEGMANALRIKAAVQFALGDGTEARATIGQSIALLSKGASPTILRKAYELSSKISGNYVHARVAREYAELGYLHTYA